MPERLTLPAGAEMFDRGQFAKLSEACGRTEYATWLLWNPDRAVFRVSCQAGFSSRLDDAGRFTYTQAFLYLLSTDQPGWRAIASPESENWINFGGKLDHQRDARAI